MGRPRVTLPPGARDMIMTMAPNGLREATAAKALGIRLRDFRSMIRKNADAMELWDEAKAIERDALLDALFNRAIEGDSKAAQFLLAARHGVTDKVPEGSSNGVNITFQLPAAMDPEKYLQALQPQKEALPPPEDTPL